MNTIMYTAWTRPVHGSVQAVYVYTAHVHSRVHDRVKAVSQLCSTDRVQVKRPVHGHNGHVRAVNTAVNTAMYTTMYKPCTQTAVYIVLSTGYVMCLIRLVNQSQPKT